VRPASERVPPGARTITIRRARWQELAPISRRLTEPAQVRQVIRWFNALPLFKPVFGYHCPIVRYSPPTVITFLSAENRVLAEASGSGRGRPCEGAIAVSVRGRTEPMLAGDFLERVLALAGLPI
jgi:hypothetical protein